MSTAFKGFLSGIAGLAWSHRSIVRSLKKNKDVSADD
jgi:hypothetical protein